MDAVMLNLLWAPHIDIIIHGQHCALILLTRTDQFTVNFVLSG